MTTDNALHNRQPHPSPFVLFGAVQPLEHAEQLARVLQQGFSGEAHGDDIRRRGNADNKYPGPHNIRVYLLRWLPHG